MGSVAIADSVVRSGFLLGRRDGLYMAYGWLKWAFPRRMQAGLINGGRRMYPSDIGRLRPSFKMGEEELMMSAAFARKTDDERCFSPFPAEQHTPR